jgi:hypothetical protein
MLAQILGVTIGDFVEEDYKFKSKIHSHFEKYWKYAKEIILEYKSLAAKALTC